VRDILLLTLVQLTARRRFVFILLLAALPVAVALAFALAQPDFDARRFADRVVVRLIASLVLPLVALLLAVAAFGDEVEDRTLAYLLLKPIPRWAIVLPKVAAAAAIASSLLAVCGGATVLLVTGEARGALAVGGGLAVAAATYAAVFTWAGLVTRHALAFGLVYIVLWEASLSNVFVGTRLFSIRQYALAVMHGLDGALPLDGRLVSLDLTAALLAAAAAMLVAGSLASLHLRTMDVP
jgi:ABC-2 type transport system permease protein